MAIRIDNDTIARVGYCLCGGQIDCFRDLEGGGWYAMCMTCGEAGPNKDDWDDAAHCYPKQ
jgi:hypothetical protein